LDDSGGKRHYQPWRDNGMSGRFWALVVTTCDLLGR
jgi:hypothetical protein